METTNAHRASTGDKGWMKKVFFGLLSVLVILAIFATASKVFGGSSRELKRKQYQALFLTNGQVYFGKLSQVDGSYVKIKDIYYLQVQQQVQPEDKKTDQQPQVSLAKLGNELHGPEDVMYVSREQVLFWENLKEDGKVAKAIKDYSAKK